MISIAKTKVYSSDMGDKIINVYVEVVEKPRPHDKEKKKIMNVLYRFSQHRREACSLTKLRQYTHLDVNVIKTCIKELLEENLIESFQTDKTTKYKPRN